MEVIVLGRGEGKTSELVLRAAGQFAYIVCPNEREAHRVFRAAYDAGIDIPHPITWSEFTTGRYHGPGIKAFMIDNLDMCIQSMTTVPVTAVTLTPGDEQLVAEGKKSVNDVRRDLGYEPEPLAGLVKMAGSNASIADLVRSVSVGGGGGGPDPSIPPCGVCGASGGGGHGGGCPNG